MQSLATGKERHLQWYRLGTDELGISSANQGIQAENELGMSLQCTLAAKRANRTLGHINSTARRLRVQFFFLTCQTLYCIQATASNFEPPIQDRYQETGGSSLGPPRCPGAGVVILLGETEVGGLVHCAEEKTLWAGDSSFLLPLSRRYKYIYIYKTFSQ